MDNPSSTNGANGVTPVAAPSPEELRKQRQAAIGAGIAAIVLIAGFVAGVIYLLQPETDTAKWRDTFLILMTLELLLIGITLALLVVQVAKLVNLVQNEVRPLMESANETMNTLRGTATFLSETVTEPVMKLSGYIASLRKVLDLFNLNL